MFVSINFLLNSEVTQIAKKQTHELEVPKEMVQTSLSSSNK